MTSPPDTAPSRVDPPTPRPAWQRNLPNALTMARLAMTVVFVAVLSVYRFPDTNTWALPTALVLFIVAALTDALDGYLARKWKVVSVFGRIMDPFADKVLVLGAFVMLAGPGFDRHDEFVSATVSGVAPWMVIVILARELLVTTIRAVLEGRGIDFSAATTGKLKMIVQAVGIPLIILAAIGAERSYDNPWAALERELPRIRAQSVAASSNLDASTIEDLSLSADALLAKASERADQVDPETLVIAHNRVAPFACAAAIIAWIVTLITAISAIPYITRAMTALKPPPAP